MMLEENVESQFFIFTHVSRKMFYMDFCPKNFAIFCVMVGGMEGLNRCLSKIQILFHNSACFLSQKDLCLLLCL